MNFEVEIKKKHPTEIILESAKYGVGLNSIQTLCLVKNIPLLFGDIIPAENKKTVICHCCYFNICITLLLFFTPEEKQTVQKQTFSHIR